MMSSTISEQTALDEPSSTRADAAAARVAKRMTRAEVAASLFGQKAPVVVGRFELGRAIGRGAMGKVYDAFDPTLERRVALKVISGRPGFSAERLLDEARALARLDHPHVVTIHEAGITPEGVVFCAMALLDGEDLRTRWQREAPARDALVATVQQLASALGALHERGVVHRDVKPENVVMVDERPVLVDFGVARQTRAAGGEVERGYAVAGTPGYMAPEQRAGDAGDSLSDQFALAMMACEGLFGARPRVDAGESEVAVTPPPGALDDPLWPVLARALSRAPHARHPTVLAFAEAIARSEGRVEAQPQKSATRAPWRWLLVIALLGAVLYQTTRRREVPHVEPALMQLRAPPLIPFVPAADEPHHRPIVGLTDPKHADPIELIRRGVAFMKEAGPAGAQLVHAHFMGVRDGRVDVTRMDGAFAEITFEWVDPSDAARNGEAEVLFRGGRMELTFDEGMMSYRGRRLGRYLPLALPLCPLSKALQAAEGLDRSYALMVHWGLRHARPDEGSVTWHIYNRGGSQWHVNSATCELDEFLE